MIWAVVLAAAIAASAGLAVAGAGIFAFAPALMVSLGIFAIK